MESLMLSRLQMEANILPAMGLDHRTIFLNIGGQGSPCNQPFRFEIFWLMHPYIQVNIQKWWLEADSPSGNFDVSLSVAPQIHEAPS
jgi:hypothetical protein